MLKEDKDIGQKKMRNGEGRKKYEKGGMKYMRGRGGRSEG